MNKDQLTKMRDGKGFIAALDQSGGSTPKALAQYGVSEDKYETEDEMFDLVHAMRTRIITSPAFDGEHILGAILFEMTMDRQIEGMPSATYLWDKKHVVPFLKVDKGLADEKDGVQIMKPNPGLGELLKKAKDAGIFGTKERSLILNANPTGIKAVVDQQFEVAHEVLAAGLMPIVEPEVDINSPQKGESEKILKTELLAHLDKLDGQQVMLKLTLPSTPNFYKELVEHSAVLRVVALSGGYSRDRANEELAKNTGVIASFSRALTEGLSVDQSDEEFNSMLSSSIKSIYEASAK